MPDYVVQGLELLVDGLEILARPQLTVTAFRVMRPGWSVDDANSATRFAGVTGASRVMDWNALRRQKDNLVASLRQGKYIEVELNESDTEAARSTVSDMCEKLLANTVIENYDIEIVA